jgi:hypothetical protein
MITRDEYALCSYIHYRASDPRQKQSGYCCDTKEEIAAFVRITRPGLFKMIDRMEKKNLLFVDAATRAVRVTERWIDVENNTKERKQSLHDGVNKVYKERKQSLHDGVNKVTMNIKVKKDNKKDKVERESAPAQKIQFDSIPKFKTPTELKTNLTNFFKDYPEEWAQTVDAASMEYVRRKKRFDKAESDSAVASYCEWACEEQKVRFYTYQNHNARLRRWMRDQAQYSKNEMPANVLVVGENKAYNR